MRKFKKLLSVLVVMLLSFVMASCYGPAKNNDADKLKVHFIDAGQADSILIQQGDENMLIDAGNNADEDTLKSYLNNLGITEFKYVVGTHAHEDHIGSLDYIMNSFKVGKIYFPKTTSTTKTFENLVKAVQNKGMQFTVPSVGETFNLGEAKCTILAPNGSTYEDANNYSIVIKLEYGNNSFLFTGDAEDVSEKEMLSKGLDLKADVLKAGHHGSKSSSTKEFLNAVNPKYAVISVGKDNDYGHPNSETLQKFSSRGIEVYRTDESGTVVAESDGSNISFSTAPYADNSTGDSAGSAGVSNDSDKDNSDSSSSAGYGQATDTENSTASSSDNEGQDNNTGETVWVSKNGSKVYHKDKSCSGMKSSVQMTLGEAENKGMRACSKCVE
ncbi:MBL fold metallo-hydrolase [Clostridium butyricum]|uniref:ComEC/Rec2 family competence protein n=1 Tax=Clostridium butyricum TaxID=1492 RepID=UPI001CA8D65C|nr:ComEC/Rec2 family competence protein [Clostridium butyricum]MBZ0312412.1 MBL fold metallo-hydrolase [Clostridium butyricum]